MSSMAAATTGVHPLSSAASGLYRSSGSSKIPYPTRCCSAARLPGGKPPSTVASLRPLGKYSTSQFRLHANKPSKDPQEKHFEFREDVGECDIADVKDALEACKGLEGQALEDCWASFNCNVEKVTEHYAKVAGVEPKQKKGEGDTSK